MTLTELESEALSLDARSRARLAESLLASLESLPEEEVQRLWLDEAERRERDWDAGRIQGIPAEQVLSELKRDAERARLVQPGGPPGSTGCW
jgi:hypothetical protein